MPAWAFMSALALSTEDEQGAPPHDELNVYPVGVDAAMAVREISSDEIELTFSEAIPDFRFTGILVGPVTFKR